MFAEENYAKRNETRRQSMGAMQSEVRTNVVHGLVCTKYLEDRTNRVRNKFGFAGLWPIFASSILSFVCLIVCLFSWLELVHICCTYICMCAIVCIKCRYTKQN